MRWGPPGGERTWQALLLFGLGSWFLVRALLAGSRPVTASVGALMILAGVGIWFRRRWSPWVSFLALGALIAFHLWGTSGKWSLWTLGYLACLIWLAWNIWTSSRTEDAAPADEPRKPLTSFVLLLKEPRALEAVVLAKILSKAWGGEWRVSDDDPERPEKGHWVVGESPIFLVGSTSGMFLVNNLQVPYFNDPKETAAAFADARLRHAIENNRGWMSVDLMIPIDPSRPTTSYYAEIARLIAELADEDVLAIYHPESERLNAWAPELEEKLRGPDPLGDFATAPHPPVLTVDGEDPRLKAAVEEARRRYPEFVEAFKAGAGEDFSVKAPVRAGDRKELIWVKVAGFEPTVIHGELANEPVSLGGLKLGDRVEIPVEDLADWVYLRDGEPVGLFTQAVILKIQEEKRRS